MSLDFDSLNVFLKYPSYVPWFDQSTGKYYVIVQPAVRSSGATSSSGPRSSAKSSKKSGVGSSMSPGRATETEPESPNPPSDQVLKKQAVDAFIEYYLPEFYPFLYANSKKRPAAPAKFTSTYNQLRKEIENNLGYVKTDTDDDSPMNALVPLPKYLFASGVGALNFKNIRLGLQMHGVDSDRLLQDARIQRGKGDCPDAKAGDTLPTYDSGFPRWSDALNFFNEQQRIPGDELNAADVAIINLGGVVDTIFKLEAILDSYDQNIQRFGSPLRIPIELAAIRDSVKRFLGNVTNMVRRDINLTGLPVLPFSKEDILYIEFDKKQQIKAAYYDVDLGKETVSSPLKVGYLSMVKHDLILLDRWVMATIINHGKIINRYPKKKANRGGGLPSFMKFIETTYGKLLKDPDANPSINEAAINFLAPAPPGIDPVQFSIIFTAKDGNSPIDILNPANLGNSLSTFLTSKEVGEINAALNNPVHLAALYNDMKSKMVPNTFPLKDTIDKIILLINTAKGQQSDMKAVNDMKAVRDSYVANREEVEGMPGDNTSLLASIDADIDAVEAQIEQAQPSDVGAAKEQVQTVQEIVDTVLSLFGITDLIAEALICLTMGTTFSLARINEAIELGFGIAQFIEDYENPQIPVPILVIPEIPKIEIPSFNIMGDPPLWQQILDIVLQTLVDVAFEIIQGLAEMIMLNCNNLLNRPEQMGVVNAADAMRDNLNQPIHLPDMQDLLDEAFNKFGLNQDKGFDYLQNVSVGLSPFELCQLYNSRKDVSDTTIQKISHFNKGYPDENIQKMRSRNQILAFFGSMSSLCDITPVCNEWINEPNLRDTLENYCLKDGNLADLADNETIEKLAGYLNEGIPVEIPPIDFLCPDSDHFIPNPVVSRVIPQTFNTLIENAKLQFIYSVEATRTTLLEPRVHTDANPGLEKALAVLGEQDKLPGYKNPPKIDTAFLDILSEVFDQLQNPDFEIDPEACADLDLDKFGVPLPEFLKVANQLLQDSLGAANNLMDQARQQITEIQDEARGSNGTPYVTYVFPKDFNNNFKAMARQKAPKYVDIMGSKHGDYWKTTTTSPGGQRAFRSEMVKDYSTSEFGKLYMTWNFFPNTGPPNTDAIGIIYTSNDDINAPKRPRLPVRLRVPEGLLPGVKAKWVSIAPEDTSFTPLYGDQVTAGKSSASPMDGMLAEMGTESGFNPYIANFSYALSQQLLSLGNLAPWDRKYLQDKLQKQVYPVAFNGLVKRSFDYISKHGIFSMVALNKLNLFKDNTDCSPSQIGDLLDVDGILDQVKKEFKESSCNDGKNAKETATDALKFALVNLLIQVYFVELLLKNIFVFSAFNFEEIINKPVIKNLILKSLTTEIEEKLGGDVRGLKKWIYKYFETKLVRQVIVDAGGIAHSYSPTEVVPYLEAGDSVESIPFSKLLGFLIEERLGYTYESCGKMVTTMTSINNVLSLAGADKSMDQIFLDDILGMYKSPYGKKRAPTKTGEGRIFFSKYAYWEGISNWSALASSEVRVPWDPKELAKAQTVYDGAFAAALISPEAVQQLQMWTGQGIVSVSEREELLMEYVLDIVGPRPLQEVPRWTLNLQQILGTAGAGSIPLRTATAVDFMDLIDLTAGARPVFEGLKLGYKLIFNFPSYRGTSYAANDWDQSDSPFINSFRPGPVRQLMKQAIDFQGRAIGKDSITDAIQGDMDPANEGSQIIGELLTVDIRAVGDFNPNELESVIASEASQPPPEPPAPSNGPGIPSMGEAPPYDPNRETVMSTEALYSRVKRFNSRSDTAHRGTILRDTEYRRFINQTFNPETIFLIPVLYNLGLTNYFFSDVERNFETTKQVILDLFGMVSSTHRAPALIENNTALDLANNLGSDGESTFEMNAREFILKVLRETPIKILKGVVELVDPHVALSKIIRDITGQVFMTITNIMDAGITIAASAMPDNPMKEMMEKMKGDDILALAFCGLNTLNHMASNKLPDPPGPLEAPLLGPRMTLNGVDFTGTLSGLFMLPPTPLGIIYILIMLLMEMEDDTAGEEGTDGSQANVADGQTSNVC